MNKIVFTILLMFSGFLIQAQTVESIQAKWAFSDLSNKEKIEPDKYNMLLQFFESFSFEAMDQKKYKGFFLGKEEQGTWQLEDKTILLVSEKDKKSSFEIITFSEEQMTIKIGTAMLILKKETE